MTCNNNDCINRVKLLEEENKILLDRLKENDGLYKNEILKLKTDYDELRIEYLFYEKIILEAIEKNENNNLSNNNDGTTSPNSGNGEGDKKD